MILSYYPKILSKYWEMRIKEQLHTFYAVDECKNGHGSHKEDLVGRLQWYHWKEEEQGLHGK